MLRIWYTDPSKGSFGANPKKFSSYYQYNTITKEFVRIRLELGRSDNGETFVGYKEGRTVGFSKERFSTSDGEWSVDAAGQLSHAGEALARVPKEGDRTYDTTDPHNFVHRGNPVISQPNFPAGIEAKHLNLLANQALLDKGKVIVSESNASAQDLATALKDQVSAVVEKPFKDITDADILTTLKKQLTDIKNASAKPAEAAVGECVKQAEALVEEVSAKMDSGEFTPGADFEAQFSSFAESFEQMNGAVENKTGVSQAVAEFKAAHDAFNQVVNTLAEGQRVAFERAVADSTSAVATAAERTAQLEAFDTKVAEVEETQTMEEYEEAMAPEVEAK